LLERTRLFALGVLAFCRQLPSTPEAQEAARQLRQAANSTRSRTGTLVLMPTFCRRPEKLPAFWAGGANGAQEYGLALLDCVSKIA
jgi:hypothetical protein